MTDPSDSDQPPPPGEQRDTRRVHVSTNVGVRDAVEFTVGAGTDVSVGGLYVLAYDRLRTGTLLEARCDFDDLDRVIEALGVVRWCRPQPVGDDDRYGLGIEFLDLEPEDRDALEAFVEKHDSLDEPSAPDADDSSERRERERVPVSAGVTLRTVANLTMATGSDLSADGIYIVTPEKYSVGRRLELEITAEGLQNPVQALGQVRWRQPHELGGQDYYGVGIEFIDLDPDDRRRLESFTERRQPRPASRREDLLDPDD